MVHYIPGWFYPVPAAGPVGSSDSSFGDTILAIALSALALISANAFDRTNPGLAVVLRCAAGGIGLIWLFSRCCPTSGGGAPVHAAPPPPVHPVPPPARPWHWGWTRPAPPYSPPVYTRHAHHTTYVPPAPAPRGFPTAYRAPAQPDTTPMYEVPKTRGGFPTAYPTTSSTHTTTTHTYVPDPHPPKTAHTTYSHAAGSAPGGFPTAHTYPSRSSTSTTTTYTFVPPSAPGPTHHAPYTTGFTTAGPAPGAFPTVHRAPAQPDSTPMHSVPKTRGM